MFLEYLYNFPNSSVGMDTAMISLFGEIPILTPMILCFVFFVVLLGGSSAQSRKTGYSDLPMWSGIASISTLMIALAMSLVQGMINLFTLVIVVVITIICGVWAFLDHNNREV